MMTAREQEARFNRCKADPVVPIRITAVYSPAGAGGRSVHTCWSVEAYERLDERLTKMNYELQDLIVDPHGQYIPPRVSTWNDTTSSNTSDYRRYIFSRWLEIQRKALIN